MKNSAPKRSSTKQSRKPIAAFEDLKKLAVLHQVSCFDHRTSLQSVRDWQDPIDPASKVFRKTCSETDTSVPKEWSVQICWNQREPTIGSTEESEVDALKDF